MSDVKALAAKLNTILHDLSETIVQVDKQIAHTDNRELHADFRSVNNIGLVEMRVLLDGEATKLKTRLELLEAHTYLADMEALHGEGNWRNIVEEESHLRLSIRAITAMRMHIPSIELKQAKLLVEAYTAKQFS